MRLRTWMTGMLTSALVAGQSGASMADDGLKVWLEPHEADGHVQIIAFARADAPSTLHYKITVQRTGLAGQARTTQGGQVTIETPGTAVRLASTTLSVDPDDTYKIDVSAWEPNGRSVGQATRTQRAGQRRP